MPSSPPTRLPGPRARLLRLENFVPYRLSVLSNRVSSVIASAYSTRFGLSIPQWRVLAVLAVRPGLSAAEVVERTAMDKVAVSRAVAALLAAGRLERRFTSSDRRRSRLRLSAAGTRVYRRVVPVALACERALMDALDPQDRATFERMLAQLTARARELGNELAGTGVSEKGPGHTQGDRA